jgi:hypothetical protein
MLNKVHHNSLNNSNHSNHHHHHRSHRSSPALPIHNGTNQYLDSHNYLQTPVSLSSIQCSAYFIHRVDLDNYTVFTLKQTVDNIVSGRKSKG